MPSTPAINATVTITVRDINNNLVPKTFTQVRQLNFDYFDGTLNIVDTAQGSFYFGIATVTTVTYVVAGTVTTIVMS